MEFQFFHVVFEDTSQRILDQVGELLEQNSSVLRHPAREHATYVVCDSPGGVAYRAARFAEDPTSPFDTNGMVSIRDSYISVFLPGVPEIHDQIVAAVLPLIEQHKCRIMDEFGRDHTDKYAGRFHKLFELH